MNKYKKFLSILSFVLIFSLTGCGQTINVGEENFSYQKEDSIEASQVSSTSENYIVKDVEEKEVIEDIPITPILITPSETETLDEDKKEVEVIEENNSQEVEIIETKENTSNNTSFEIPTYTGKAWVYINDNKPFFTEKDYTLQPFEKYSELDSLGRCGVAFANICTKIMPTEERGSIGNVKPSGWVQNKYDFVDGKYLYNRCHLIGFQLAGENDNPKNLITGTRYLNIDGMLNFENEIAQYVKDTNHHCLYRVTPIFEGENLLCSGLLMEAQSMEDDEISFCVYAFNVQPNVDIDYKTGDNHLSEKSNQIEENSSSNNNNSEEVNHYIININSNKFHLESCSKLPSEKNRKDVDSTRSKMIEEGYSPCGICKP